jgi:hypothetical protein
MKLLRQLWNDIEARGEIIKTIGFGIFINGTYGISDGSIELFNSLDILMGLIGIITGIILERKEKWQDI